MSVLDVSVNGRASAEDVYDPFQTVPTDHLYKLGRHPIEKDTAILPTNAMEEFVNTLLGWLAGRLTGAIVWGNQRVGKTQAIRYVMANGQALLGAPIPISLLSAWDPTHSSLSENRFFRELLRAIGSHVQGSATASDLRRSAIDVMTDQVRSTKEYRYLLFIDEAQWLAPVQLRYLMDLHNHLKIADIRLITVLVGQPELIDNKLSLRNARQNHLLGRFMTATHQYTGLCAETEFRRLCRALDSQSEFPVGSGIQYTQYFVPKAYQAGWRLEKQAALIWRTLDQIMKENNVPSCKELPMQAIMALVVWLLQVLSDLDSESLCLERGIVEEAIYRVALVQIDDHAHQISKR